MKNLVSGLLLGLLVSMSHALTIEFSVSPDAQSVENNAQAAEQQGTARFFSAFMANMNRAFGERLADIGVHHVELVFGHEAIDIPNNGVVELSQNQVAALQTAYEAHNVRVAFHLDNANEDEPGVVVNVDFSEFGSHFEHLDSITFRLDRQDNQYTAASGSYVGTTEDPDAINARDLRLIQKLFGKKTPDSKEGEGAVSSNNNNSHNDNNNSNDNSNNDNSNDNS